jgi:hypothetical protein
MTDTNTQSIREGLNEIIIRDRYHQQTNEETIDQIFSLIEGMIPEKKPEKWLAGKYEFDDNEGFNSAIDQFRSNLGLK